MTSNVDGTQKITIVPGNNTSGLFASDGSWRGVLNASTTGSPYGIQHYSGAYNVSVGDTSNYYTPNGNINVYNGTYGYTPTTTPTGSPAAVGTTSGQPIGLLLVLTKAS